MPLEQALEVACRAADEARARIMARYHGGFSVSTKADRSPVTEADREAERAIRDVIKGVFPDHAVLGEELGGGHEAPLRWVVDPIDGTISFTHRIPLFTTLIALCHESEPVVSVIDLPALGRRLTAIRGQGAWEDGRRLKVAPDFDPAASVVSHGDAYAFEVAGEMALYRAVETGVRLFRSYTDAFGHVLVALGAMSAMIDADLKPWDVAAPQLVVTEAGGKIVVHPDRRANGHVLLISGAPRAIEWIEELIAGLHGGASALIHPQSLH